jgi:transposase
MSGTRRQYTQEFKDSAVKLTTEQGYRLSEASRSLSVNVSVLRRWKKAAEGIDEGRVGTQSKVDLNAELTRLRKENRRLKLEREILKKAAAFFAKESGNGID